MIQEIGNALVESWRNFATAFVLFVPRLVAATIIFAGGLVVALTVKRLVHRLLLSVRFERFARTSGGSELLRRAEMPPADVLIAKIVFWLVWIGFIVSAVDTLQFEPFQGLVAQFFRFTFARLFDGFKRLVRLFEQHRRERGVGLFAVPGTAGRRAQTIHQSYEITECCWHASSLR